MPRSIHRKTVTDAAILAAVADDLSKIKYEDRLTWKDIGRVLDRHHDHVPGYADGSTKIDILAYTRAEQEWGSRFTGSLRRLVHDNRAELDTDRGRGSKVLAAALAMSVALEDGEIDADEVRRDRATLEAARDAICAVLAKLTPRAA